MRAKDYARQFNENPSLETIQKIATAFLNEMQQIARVRKAKSPSAYFAILNEQDLKWQALAREIDGIKPDGFGELVREIEPGLYELWRAKR